MNKSSHRRLAVTLSAAVVCASALAGASTAALAQTEVPGEAVPVFSNCAGTYQVLERSQAGSLKLAAGAYRLAPTANLNCNEAARLFGEFQKSWGTKLPLGWKSVSGPTGFANAAGQRFRVARATVAGSSTRGCPYLSVVQAGKLNQLSVAAGRYRLLRSSTSLSCAAVARNFFALLYKTGEPDGSWRAARLGPGAIQLSRGSASFTARFAYRAVDGAGTFPSRGEYRCGPFFTVNNNDPIGKKFLVNKGRYSITTFGSTDCAKAVKILPTLLGQRSGVLPSPWRLRGGTGSFVRSASGAHGFRLSPYRGQ